MPVIYGEEENDESGSPTKQDEETDLKPVDGGSTDGPGSAKQDGEADSKDEKPRSELASLQEELRRLTASPADFTGKDDKIHEQKAKVAQVLTKIKKLQNSQLLVKSFDQASPVTHSLQYLNHFALDLARLLHVLFKKVTLTGSSFKDFMRVIEPSEE
jgi:hypothetical protein